MNSRSLVCVYIDLPPRLTTRSGLDHCSPLSVALFTFVVKMVMELVLSSYMYNGIDISSMIYLTWNMRIVLFVPNSDPN